MKNGKKIYLSAALMLVTLGTVTAGTPQDIPVRVVCHDLVQKGDSLYIDAEIYLPGQINTNRSLTLTPVLESAGQREGLPSIRMNGKRRNKIYKREIALGNLDEVPHFAVLTSDDTPEHIVSYKMAIAWESWMKEARLVLQPDLCGCGKEVPASPLLIADKIRMRPTERYRVHPVFVYIKPQAETEKHRAEAGTAYLDFQVGKTQILPDYRNNAAELSKIDATIHTVTADKNITLKGIALKGYASPEGSYASNQRLAIGRVQALRDYIRSKNDFPVSFFTLDAVAEDWDGFKTRAEADLDIPAHEEVLSIIDNDEEPDRKEAQLRALKGGTAYRYVLNVLFPSLRRSEYRIDYTVRFFTVEEGREIIKTHPAQLSLSEMFAVANSYEPGSEEYNRIFDIAVRLYATDPIANLNAANIALAKDDLTAARQYLTKAGNSPEAIHARGILALLEDHLEEAGVLLRQAADAGIKEAETNLSELQKKREDNALFDSFK